MRKTKVKEIKKIAVLSLAVFMLGSGFAMAATNWTEAQNEANTTGTVNIENNMSTGGTALNLGTPPVPGGMTLINGNGHTISADSAASTGNFIINNVPDANTVITNTNFEGGNLTEGNGGAIRNTANLSVYSTDPNNKAHFSNNIAGSTNGGNGGAVTNTGVGVASFDNVIFENNQALGSGFGLGGAIYNQSTASGVTLDISNSEFNNNSSRAFGGAIINLGGMVNIDSTSFNGNYTTAGAGQGGAILNAADMVISNSSFTGNNTTDFGGAIATSLRVTSTGTTVAGHDINLTINNTLFENNYSTTGGGAIYNAGGSGAAGGGESYSNTININSGSRFVNNYAVSGRGGAISNATASSPDSGDTNGIINIQGAQGNQVVFEGNIAGRGGAISNQGTLNVDHAVFNNNGGSREVTQPSTQTITTSMGGAIYNESQNTQEATVATISNSLFTNNTATSGGAIYNASGTVNVIDSDFYGNRANSTSQGGAVYGADGSTTVLRAQNRDMNIGNENSIANGTDSLAFTSGATASLQAAEGRNLNIYSNIEGARSGDSSTATELNINSDYQNGSSGSIASTGTVTIKGNATIRNTNISLRNGTLSFDHDRGLGTTANGGNGNVLNLYGGTLDLLNNEFGPNQLAVQELNLLGDTNIQLDVDLAGQYTGGTPSMDSLIDSNVNVGTVDPDAILTISQMKSVSDAKSDTVKIMFTDADDLIDHVQLGQGANIVEAPIYKYKVDHITQYQPGSDGTPAGEYFQFTQMGNSDNVISGAVAAQGAFLVMDNLYRQSFANMDLVTLMTPEERMAWKMRNKYASAYHTGVYAPNVIPEERDGWYMRPFTNFENVPLKNGPKVSNVSYGSLFGGESDLIDLGHGWDGNFSFFGAYHGSHQAYNGVSIYQNGGTIGGVATAYKGNFWTGITANIGASAARATHSFGADDFPILMTGAAWKSGYNWNLFKNKVIVQPSYMMSYTFVNVFDYNSASGVRISQDPLHAIEIIPGIRIIGNLKNGWQPYLGVNMTWNIMDKTKFYANEVALSELSVKPYIEYGVGLQKRYGDRFTGFGQAMLRNGGRNGIAFTLGFRWALGN